jgi:hypothetical protein
MILMMKSILLVPWDPHRPLQSTFTCIFSPGPPSTREREALWTRFIDGDHGLMMTVAIMMTDTEHLS